MVIITFDIKEGRCISALHYYYHTRRETVDVFYHFSKVK